MAKYIAKPNTWYIVGTEATLLVDCRPQLNIGIFLGSRKSEGTPELHPVGEVYNDEEACGFDEFEEIND